MKTLIITGVLVFAACSGDGANQADLGSVDSGPCGVGIYPCGPYGTTVGNTAANLTFSAFAAPDDLCTVEKDKTLDLSQTVSLSFASWHLPPTGCADKHKQLLWVMVAAGWCAPCLKEAKEVVQKIQDGSFDARVGLLSILVEDKDHLPVSEAFVRDLWVKETGVSYPVALDPNFQMGAYFTKSSMPFNMLIDLRTMKIQHRQVGNQTAEIWRQIEAFFK
ncbi:MAG: TlpA family protein disulfide reductase [Deltaproteobacteria bacterium]|nr:TlpA family protein disulfide reductase [Deltaproteobacteria bacterium]